jgi:hypothetical protein
MPKEATNEAAILGDPFHEVCDDLGVAEEAIK